MGSVCAKVTNEEVNTLKDVFSKSVIPKLKLLNIDTSKLTREEVIAVISKLMTEKGYTLETVMNMLTSSNTRMLNDAISAARIKKEEEQEVLNNNKIGNAEFIVGEKIEKKGTVPSNTDTLYIFTDNLQASNVRFAEENPIGDVIEVENGPTLNVKSTSALMRTNANGEFNENAYGLVTKKNAQDAKGKWLMEGGYFQDNESDFSIFVEANERVISKIKTIIFDENSPYTKIIMVEGLATEKAALPKRFAEKLADMLEEELGIYTQLVKSKNGYGLKVMPKGKKAKKDTKKQEALEKAKKKAAEILESLAATRPRLDSIEVDPEDRSLLSRVFPNIEQRMARVLFISEAFSRKLTNYIKSITKAYSSIEDRSEDEEFYYNGLTRGTEEKQRLFALSNISIKGEPLGSYILNEIRRDMESVVQLGSTEEGIEELANQLLKGEGELGINFKQETIYRNINSKERIRTFAFSRARYLVEQYGIMINQNVFNALCRDASYEIEFNENIRLNFKSLPIKGEDEFNKDTSTDYNEDTIEEEKENANKEGYMIKYKELDPSKSLTTNIKKLLGSLYKKDYANSNEYVFNDLGERVKMDAMVAYKILLEEFSRMTKPEDFIPILDETIEKYSWLGSLRDILVFNPANPKAFNNDLKNEFFSVMRKAQVPYGTVSSNGLIKRLNRSNSSEDILENVRANYEGRVVLGSHSIYNESGEIDIDNCIAIHKLFSDRYGTEKITGNTKEDRKKKRFLFYKNSPLGWALSKLRTHVKREGIVEDVIKAIDILIGLSEDHNFTGLEDVLRNLGIDTSKMDIDSLFGKFPFLSEEEINEIETIEDLAQYITDSQITRIIRILEAISNIVNQGNPNSLKKGDHLVSKFQSSYLKLGGALCQAAEGYTSMSFRHKQATRASYAAPDFISDLVGTISNMDNIEDANRWIEENYGQYDFFKDPSTKEWMNTWLEDFFYMDNNGNFPYRRGFEYINILSFLDEEISEILPETLIKGLVFAFNSANDVDEVSYGWYRSPLISDTDACILFKGRRFTGENYQDEIIKRLIKVVLQEVSRINAVLVTKNKKDTTKIEFYNSKQENGTKFNYFPELNERLPEILNICTLHPGESPIEFEKRRDKKLKEIIGDLLKVKANRFLDTISKSDKLTIYRTISKKATTDITDTESDAVALYDEEEEVDNSNLSKEQQIARAEELLLEFYYNDFYAHSQIQQLVGGDLAMYKNFTDYVKRNKQAYACGERLFARETDEQGNIVGTLEERVMYLEDEDVMSNSYEKLKDLLMSADLTDSERAVMRGTLEAYKKICSTDGQSLRSLDSFRKIYKAKGGVWTDEMEESYQNIKAGKFTVKDFISLWNPIKPFFFGSETIKIGDRTEKIMVQHKNSEYMITAFYSFMNTALNRSPKLVGLHSFMDKHNIDVVHFHSVVKEGFNSPFDLRYNSTKYNKYLELGKVIINGEEFKGDYESYVKKLQDLLDAGSISQEEYTSYVNEFQFKTAREVENALEKQLKDSPGSPMIKIFPMDSYMIVQPSGDHLIDAEAIFGTQIKNIIMADLPEDFNFTINLDGKDVNMDREEAVRFFNTLLVDNLLDAFSLVGEEFSDIHSLQKALFAKMQGNPKYGDDVKAALEINEDGTGFMLPFNSPNLSNKIEELVLSTFKNAIQRQKIKGGNAVLVSNFGLHDDLHVVYKDNDKSKGVDYIEAYLPATSAVMFRDFLVDKGEYQVIDFDKMKNTLGEAGSQELLDVIGYRIPTEDKYSIMPIRVIGFMPISAGSTIMLPADIITMSGTDFDIDKLFLMLKEFDRIDYGSSLFGRYQKWIKNKNKKGEIEEDLDKVLKILKYRKEGYTEDYIYDLEGKYEIFEEFMNAEGYKDLYKTPQYKIVQPVTSRDGKSLSLDDISKQESIKSRRRRIAIRNNMLIDVMKQTLKDENVSKLLMQPGNFDRVRHASRQQQIMHNPKALAAFRVKYKDEIAKKGMFTVLQGLSTKTLEEFYRDNASPISPLDIVDYAQMQKNLMDGNALIGMFAVNSSNHYKLQFTPVEIDKQYQFVLNGVPITSLDLVNSPLSGELVGKICAELQAASPDNGKDPCLGDIGANIKTANKVGTMARMGFIPEIIGMFNTCDDFISYGKEVIKALKQSKYILPNLTTFNLDMDKFTEMLAIYRSDREEFDRYMQIPENTIFVAMATKFLENIRAISSSTSKVSKVSRADSPNGALPISVPEVIQQLLAAEDFIRGAKAGDSPVKGLEKLVDITIDAREAPFSKEAKERVREQILSTPVPRLQAAYTLGIASAVSLCRDLFPGLSDATIEGVKLLRSQLQKELTYKEDTATIRKFIAELTMAMLSENSPFATNEDESILEKRNYYIHDFPMKYKAFKEEKDDNGNFKHGEVNNLDIIQRISNRSERGIKFNNVSKVSDRSRKHFVEQLNSLIESPKKSVQDMGQDLFMYSYYDNGLQFSHNNFGIFFTTFYLKNIPGFIPAINRANAKLVNGEFNMTNYVFQFILNYPELAPAIKGNNFTIKDNKLIPTEKGKYKFYGNADNTGLPVMFIQAKGKLWVKNGEGSDLHYVEIGYNDTKVPYYDMSSSFYDIDYSKLKKRGKVGEVSNKKEENKKENKNDKNTTMTEPKDIKDPKGMKIPAEAADNLNVPKDVDDISQNIPSDSYDSLGDAPIDMGDTLLLLVPKDENEEPEGLLEAAKAITELEERLSTLEESIVALSKNLEKDTQDITDDMEVPKEDLSKFVPTEDPNLKVCNSKNS